MQPQCYISAGSDCNGDNVNVKCYVIRLYGGKTGGSDSHRVSSANDYVSVMLMCHVTQCMVLVVLPNMSTLY